MLFGDQAPKPFILNVRINLGCCNVGMAQQLLHAPEVGPMCDQMARKGVSQDMGRKAGRIDPGLDRQVLHQLPDTTTREVAFHAT